MYDPCGTQRLEGDDIIARLADYLGIDNDEDLKQALLELVRKYKEDKPLGCEIREDRGCGCGD